VKKTILVLLACTLPAFALADDDDVHSHDSDDDVDASDTHTTTQHGHDSQHGGGMGHDKHESVAGRPGDAANASRTVDVTMDDNMRFTPDQFTFEAGETVRFVVQNNGKIPHEFVIGSMSELQEHAEMMRAMPAMQHAESNMVTLEPRAQGEVVWHFDEAGTVDFACLIPGHLEAGMKGSITVE
jgi:uncharacterized cupredoxin-like copper-binding protein